MIRALGVEGENELQAVLLVCREVQGQSTLPSKWWLAPVLTRRVDAAKGQTVLLRRIDDGDAQRHFLSDP